MGKTEDKEVEKDGERGTRREKPRDHTNSKHCTTFEKVRRDQQHTSTKTLKKIFWLFACGAYVLSSFPLLASLVTPSLSCLSLSLSQLRSLLFICAPPHLPLSPFPLPLLPYSPPPPHLSLPSGVSYRRGGGGSQVQELFCTLTSPSLIFNAVYLFFRTQRNKILFVS